MLNYEKIYELGTLFNSSLKLEEVLGSILKQLKAFFEAEASSLWLYDERSCTLSCALSENDSEHSLDGVTLPADTGSLGWCLRYKEPLFLENPKGTPLFINKIDMINDRGVSSVLLAPLVAEDRAIGIIRLVNKKYGMESFNKEDSDALGALAKSASLAVHNARLYDELSRSGRLLKEVDFASKLQMAILPGDLPDTAKLEAGAFIQAAGDLTTEFYDCISLGENRSLLALGRVGGRTLSAAIFMGIAQAMIRSLALTCSGLKEIAEITNKYLPKTIRGRTSGVKALLLLIDTDENTLEYINAGLPPPLILKGQRLDFLLNNGIPLGEFPSAHYTPEKIRLKNKSVILAYTEGVSRASGLRDEPFGVSRLARFLKRKKDLPARQMADDLRKIIFLHLGTCPQAEDMAALAVKFK